MSLKLLSNTIPDPHIDSDHDPPSSFDQSHTVTVQKRLEIKLSTATVLMLFGSQHQVERRITSICYYMQCRNDNNLRCEGRCSARHVRVPQEEILVVAQIFNKYIYLFIKIK